MKENKCPKCPACGSPLILSVDTTGGNQMEHLSLNVVSMDVDFLMTQNMHHMMNLFLS